MALSMKEMSMLRNDLNSSEQHRLVQGVRRVFIGAAVAVPSPSILRFQDVGLLYFLSQKQNRFHHQLANIDLESHPNLLPIKNLVTFVSTAVGWLIVESERIDEAIIAVKKDMSLVGNNLREADLDLQYASQHTGTDVMQAISEHHKSRVNVPQRRLHAVLEQFDPIRLQEIGELPVRIVQLRERFGVLKAHLRALHVAQHLLQGTKSRDIPQMELDAIVQDLSALTTLRKAAHKVRDAVFDIPKRESLDAIASLLEVFAYIDRGLTAALDDLEHCQVQLKKAVLLDERQSRLEYLDHLDSRNKQLSTAALKQNEELTHELGQMRIHSVSREDVMSSVPRRQIESTVVHTKPEPSERPRVRPSPPALVASHPQLQSSSVFRNDNQRGTSVSSHASEMEEFLQHYCT
jgi:hypothetical protein